MSGTKRKLKNILDSVPSGSNGGEEPPEDSDSKRRRLTGHVSKWMISWRKTWILVYG